VAAATGILPVAEEPQLDQNLTGALDPDPWASATASGEGWEGQGQPGAIHGGRRDMMTGNGTGNGMIDGIGMAMIGGGI